MDIDPVLISLIALGISLISLAVSIYQSGVDRRLQYEQKRSKIVSRITSKSLDIIPHVQELIANAKSSSISNQEKLLITVNKLTKVLSGLSEIRESVKNMNKPSMFTTSYFLKNITSIKTDLDDMEVVLDKLFIALDQNDIEKINSASNGLLERLYGANREFKEEITE